MQVPAPSQQVEEAPSHRVVMAVAPTTHRVNQVVVPEERSPVHAGEFVSPDPSGSAPCL